MKRLRIHILYEHGSDAGAFGSAYLRLLRPFQHPSIGDKVAISTGTRYEGQPVDAVIVDRLWRPDISPALARQLVEDVHRTGSRLIYALDDDLLDLAPGRMPLASVEGTSSGEEQLWVVRHFLRQADGVLVTTELLRQRFLALNPNISILMHALDESLLVGRYSQSSESPFGPRRTIIGYMGTRTHDEDLKMVLPALRRISERHRSDVEFQMIGVVGDADTSRELVELPVRSLQPRPEEGAYPLFMLWFTSRIRWDIAIAPLRDTPFNRCKSDIKFLDYSTIGAAGIYSQLPAYEATVRPREMGLLVPDDEASWVDALELLLTDDELRMRLGRNAAGYLQSERTLASRAPEWLAAVEGLLENA